jgi:hypothetical protein
MNLTYYDDRGYHVGEMNYHTHGDTGRGHWKVYTSDANASEDIAMAGTVSTRFQIGSGTSAVTRFANTNIVQFRDDDNVSLNIEPKDGLSQKAKIIFSDQQTTQIVTKYSVTRIILKLRTETEMKY